MAVVSNFLAKKMLFIFFRLLFVKFAAFDFQNTSKYLKQQIDLTRNIYKFVNFFCDLMKNGIMQAKNEIMCDATT